MTFFRGQRGPGPEVCTCTHINKMELCTTRIYICTCPFLRGFILGKWNPALSSRFGSIIQRQMIEVSITSKCNVWKVWRKGDCGKGQGVIILQCSLYLKALIERLIRYPNFRYKSNSENLIDPRCHERWRAELCPSCLPKTKLKLVTIKGRRAKSPAPSPRTEGRQVQHSWNKSMNVQLFK